MPQGRTQPCPQVMFPIAGERQFSTWRTGTPLPLFLSYTKRKNCLNTKVGSNAEHSESDLSPLVMEKNSELATPSSKKKILIRLKDEAMITLHQLLMQVASWHFPYPYKT